MLALIAGIRLVVRMYKQLLAQLLGILFHKRHKWYVLLLACLSGLVLLLFDQIPVLAYSAIAKSPYSFNKSLEAGFVGGFIEAKGLFDQSYPPPATQAPPQPALPYPPPVTPTSVGITPAYPPPVLPPATTQEPEDEPGDNDLRTPTFMPLPMEMLTLDFPPRSEVIEADTPAASLESISQARSTTPRSDQIFIGLVSLLWVMLGGWVYLIARNW